jgi:hypothetical protein
LARTIIKPAEIVRFVTDALAPGMHFKRALSIGQAVLGTMHANRLNSASIGRALARVSGITPKSGIKQVDRLLANSKFDVQAVFGLMVPWIVAQRTEIVVSLDWTEFPEHGHSCIAINLVTNHGRATPLAWRTVRSDTLKRRQIHYEQDLIALVSRLLPKSVNVVLLADRGFGNVRLYKFLETELDWDFVIRFKSDIFVENHAGEERLVCDWVPTNGKTRELVGASVTRQRHPITVVCVKHRGMKNAWHLATSLTGQKQRVVKLYGRRFSCEETFRDEKDPRFGLGLRETRTSTPERRDRLILFSMLSTLLLTMLGGAGERVGCDRALKANTSKRRTHSLLRQGREYLAGCVRRHGNALRATFLALLEAHPRETATHALI